MYLCVNLTLKSIKGRCRAADNGIMKISLFIHHSFTITSDTNYKYPALAFKVDIPPHQKSRNCHFERVESTVSKRFEINTCGISSRL